MGEYIVGAYLKLIEKCDYIDYNVRPIESGRAGQSELDVIGIKLTKNEEKIFLCEVSTHLDGLVYGSNYTETIKKIKEKYERQQDYRKKYIPGHYKECYMFWSPVVLPKLEDMIKAEEDKKLKGLEFIKNNDYFEKIEQLRKIAVSKTKDFGNPFFRTLQILEHLRKNKN